MIHGLYMLGAIVITVSAFLWLLHSKPKHLRQSLEELEAINKMHSLARLDELYQETMDKENNAPRQRRKFDALIDSLLCGVVVHYEGRVVAANTEFCLRVGEPEDVLLGTDIINVLTTDNKSIIRGYFSLVRPLNTLHAHLIHQKTSERLPVKLRSIAVHYPNVGKCHVTSVLELT